MVCNHDRIKSVNCVLFCDICGEKLPADFLTGKTRAQDQKAAETPAEPQESAVKKNTRKKVK